MAEQAEIAFIKTFSNTISTQPVTYSDDYQQPPENSLPRVPVLQVPVPAAPERKSDDEPATNESISITIKSAKPPATFNLSVLPTDTIASVKSQLFESTSSATSSTHAPPADAQRLLHKGKALADNKLLKEYPIKAGDVVNLMVKTGFDWDPSKLPSAPVTIAQPAPIVPSQSGASLTSDTGIGSGSGRRGHQRIPSVVLSPSPANDSPSPSPQFRPMDIELDIDDTQTDPPAKEVVGSYHEVVSKPEFWERLSIFLKSEFPNEIDAVTAWEEFLTISKANLTASEIAKIRDHVGVVGMAGT
ncbi:ubiquitin family protein [Moniliophthora roreri MCA 2997]|uniref:Ubiquitin family protein n=1 Tax=Moniliophthora roreri (strain MCA 2997) TaxID=1381753 RepID=V2YGQ9_MONRO|nr:ubiquitin family protein [Moniliophthora roreri MCA 2997]KAI3604864.1 ubiquitin family protein [Moniliophthora roreri]